MTRVTIRTVALSVGLVLVLASLGTRLSAMRLPGNHQGYSPDQPIAYSHRLHAGELGIDCRYCHFAAAQSRHAGIPPAGTCMNCHKSVSASRAAVLQEAELAKAEGRDVVPVVSPELRKLYRALGLDDLRQPDPKAKPHPIEWIQVHKLPDFVRFDHRSHVTADVACQSCHGPVETMERMRQHATLSMGWCVDCHRENKATLDCGACHQ
ncbi:MAG: cytochrome c3 family protein [Planctomycetota bacterium]|nr:cytochrome c3 family protein [Planctomycetota bacterium]